MILCFFLIFSYIPKDHGTSVPQPGVNLRPLQWKVES